MFTDLKTMSVAALDASIAYSVYPETYLDEMDRRWDAGLLTQCVNCGSVRNSQETSPCIGCLEHYMDALEQFLESHPCLGEKDFREAMELPTLEVIVDEAMDDPFADD